MKLKLTFATAALLFVGASAYSQTYYSQSWDGTGDSLASQYASNYGSIATTYDDFTFASSFVEFNTVSWVGSYFNPSEEGDITGFNIDFYYDNAGSPGTEAFGVYVSGDADQTFLGDDQYGDPDYSYSANIGEVQASGYGPFWLSIQAVADFPPQWGWDTSSQGNDNSYQTFLGTTSYVGTNQAFALSQSNASSVPGPAAIAPFALGLIGAMRRRKSR